MKLRTNFRNPIDKVLLVVVIVYTTSKPWTLWAKTNPLLEMRDVDGHSINHNKYIAIRRGNRVVRNCIFLDWADCSSFLSNDDKEEVEFSVFEHIDDAITYIRIPDQSPPLHNSNPFDLPGVNLPAMNPDIALDVLANDSPTAIAISPVLTDTESAKDKQSTPCTSDERVKNSSGIKRKRTMDGSVESAKVPSKVWEKMFSVLKAYKDQYGTLDIKVQEDHPLSNELHRWVLEQRKAFRKFKSGFKNAFSDKKVARLLELGFDFQFYTWECRYEQLKGFQATHNGTGSNFDDHLSNHDHGLYLWWEQQRKQYLAHCKGKPSNLSSIQINQLRKFGMSTRAPKVDEDFEKMMMELLSHKKTHGHCNVSMSDNIPLARWVSKQRLQYRRLKEGKVSHLTAERMARLTDIGFIFSSKEKITSWDERLSMLREKHRADGHIRFHKSDQAMRSWINRIRKEYQAFQEGERTQLTQEKINQLNELGMVWVTGFPSGTTHAPRKTWNERFEDLKDFIRNNGHSFVPQAMPGLGEWVHTQRAEYKKMQKGEKSVLTAERALKLVEVGFCFDAKKQRGKGGDLRDIAP